jgi:uncharacterized Zn finger protein
MPRPPESGFPPPSKPLPADGIRAKSRRGPIGDRWWSQRFTAILESFELGGRLARGRNYARRGQVVELVVETGAVRARVQGSRPTPYAVSIRLKALPEKDWARVEAALAGRAVFLAKLLAGEMPTDVEEAFADCRLSLFPSTARDLRTSCTCPDSSNPCKHIAATYYLLAEAFDDDPFLIMAWRGRGRAELVARLLGREPGRADPQDPEVWTAPAVPVPDLADCLASFYDDPGPLPQPVAAQPGSHPDAVLLELDDPPVDIRGHSLTELLRPAYPAMSDAARRRITSPATAHQDQ